MLLKEFLELNYNNDYIDIYLEATDGFDWFYKNNIPTNLLNRKIISWRVDGEFGGFTIEIEGKIFADGNKK